METPQLRNSLFNISGISAQSCSRLQCKRSYLFLRSVRSHTNFQQTLLFLCMNFSKPCRSEPCNLFVPHPLICCVVRFRLEASRRWFAQCCGPETEKTSQSQPSAPCAISRPDIRTPRWPRMPCGCTTACPWSSSYCIHHHIGPSSRYAIYVLIYV